MKTLLLAGALAAPFAVSAADDAVTLDPVVVTASGVQQPASEVLAAVTVIDREQIERSLAYDLADLLRFEAGIELGRTGGPGQQTGVFIRGGESNHTLVLIDGQRVNPATSGGAALQNIAPEMIERIEIVRGPRSTLYGSDAIGGVINVITRAPQRPSASLSGRAGAYDTREIAAMLAYGDGDKRLSLDASHLRSEGYPSCSGASADRPYDRASVNLNGSAPVGGTTVGVRLWNSQGTADYFDFCDPLFGFNPRSQDYQNQVGAIDLTRRFGARWSSTLGIARMQDDIRQNDSSDYVRTTRPSLSWDNLVSVGSAQRISFGAEAAREQVDADTFGSAIAEDRDLVSGFVQDELSLGRHRVLAGVSLADYDAFGTQFNWNLEYGIDLRAGTRLIAAAATGFRAPDATDRFGFGGNPELEPEEARNFELGLRQQFGAQHSVDLRLFQSEVDDLINLACDEFFNCLAVNVDEYRNRGAELAWQLRTAGWSARVSGILQKPEDRSTGEPLLRRAERSAAARLAREFAGGHYLALDLLGSGERADFGGTTLGGYALLNLGAGYRLDAHLELRASIENLLDKDYQTAAGYDTPGCTGYVSVAWRY